MRFRTGVPHASMRAARVLVCAASAVLLAAASVPLTGDGAVISVSVEPTSGRAHVVIGVDGNVAVKDFVLHEPERIVVDITGATLGVKKRGYDRVARGGVLDVRWAQNQPNVVRVVLTLAGPKHYTVSKGTGEIRVSVDGGGDFTAWRANDQAPVAAGTRTASGQPSWSKDANKYREKNTITWTGVPTLARANVSVDTPPPSPLPITSSTTTLPPNASITPAVPTQAPVTATVGVVPAQNAVFQQVPRQQPRITIAWENADIRDVLAAFAAFSGRTIIPARGVEAKITAEIVDKPWDVAMDAILRANGFGAIEDQNGIIIVNTLEALATRPRFEALTTRTVRLNYIDAVAVAAALQGRLSRDCSLLQSTAAGASAPTAPTPGAPGAAGTPAPSSTVVISGGNQAPQLCPTRGAVTADSLSNSVSITDVPTAMDDLIAYARSLDLRQPQVNIKAKIILVDRTQLEGLGLKYDLGTRNQHFNDVVTRVDSSGNAESGTLIFLGGNTLSAIANAAQDVPNAALRLVYSAALGAFDFTTFLDALEEVSLLDVQAEPSVTTLNYRKAVLSAGTQVPIRTIEQGTGGNAAGAFPRVTVTMRQTGVVLEVTPAITNNRQILMQVHAENSDVQFQGGDVGAVFPTQSIDNQLLVADGETAVMGGLTQTSVRVTKSGIPLLVDLPLIGRLFGVTNRSETKRDLLILITPHIVDEGDLAMEPRRNP